MQQNAVAEWTVEDEPVPVRVGKLELYLSQATTPEDFKRVISATSAAITAAMTLRKMMGTEYADMVQRLSAVKFDAEAKLGAALLTMEKSTGNRGNKQSGMRGSDLTGGTGGEPPVNPPTLEELGIDKRTSARAQKVAALPEEVKAAVRSGEVSANQALADAKPPKPVAAESEVDKLKGRIATLEAQLEETKIYLQDAEDKAESMSIELENLQAIAAGDDAKRMNVLTAKLRAAETSRNVATTEKSQLLRQNRILEKQIHALERRVEKK